MFSICQKRAAFSEVPLLPPWSPLPKYFRPIQFFHMLLEACGLKALNGTFTVVYALLSWLQKQNYSRQLNQLPLLQNQSSNFPVVLGSEIWLHINSVCPRTK